MSNQSFETVLGVQIPPFHQCVFGTGTKRKTQTWRKTPELTIFLSGRNAKKSKTCQNISQSSCSNIEFCKPNRNKSTAMLQKDIYQVTEADQANIWNCIKKWVSSTKPTKYSFFHLKKKKQKKLVLILNWTDCMQFSVKLVNGILKSKKLLIDISARVSPVNHLLLKEFSQLAAHVVEWLKSK